MFTKVLIANRGEIAVRVAQTLREMGIRVAAVHSAADRGALHVEAADEAHALPGAASRDTYLRGDLIVEIARRCGAEAIHPGYGFLSENAAFARACESAGIAFIGPPSAAIAAMGDKVSAKKRMETAGVPVLPGWSGGADAPLEEITAAAQKVGYPLMVKAAAGGGGKGMRVVEAPAQLAAAIESARREAGSAFGDARVFLERYLARARHIEIQIFADGHGNAIHLNERECSIQRRHQKIVEEAPSPAVDADLRRRMGEAAVRAARAIGYVNAGTVEFLLDEKGSYSFLEMNTRLQVEHPVTEMTTGLDLVRAQVLVAAGEKLPFGQADVAPRGHAVECRVYAEDPAAGFLPQTGVVERWEPPAGAGVRLDSGVAAGAEISVHYDPMLAKLVVHAGDREAAIARMQAALRRFVIMGVKTNLALLDEILAHPAFARGALHTRFLDEHGLTGARAAAVPEEVLAAAALALAPAAGSGADGAAPAARTDPWATAGRWRIE
jgi:3-methylcrotonyl-CoA carboxylase alpha subunit